MPGYTSDGRKRNRRSVRLSGYDYGEDGAYFVTICTQNRKPFFDNETVRGLAERCWEAIPSPANPFSVMSPRPNTLSVIVRTYKAAVTTACRRAGRRDFRWQRNFFERVIRNEHELSKVRHYIADNPAALSLFKDYGGFK